MSKTITNQITFVGVPLDLGAKNLGVDLGPQAFRHQHTIKKLENAGLAVEDAGNIICRGRKGLKQGSPRLRYMDEIVRVNEELAQIAEKAVRAGHKLVAIGGDHSVSLGSVSGASTALDGKLGLIYFDAHGDMNTDKTTLTGNIHGMQLASLMGFGAPALAQVGGKSTKIAKNNMIHIGGCDFDQSELDFVKQEGLHAFSMLDLMRQGLGPLLKMIDDLAARVPNIYISLDLDSIDSIYAPGAGMPNAKGLTYREIDALAEYIGATCNVVGVDIVEYNPLLDVKNKTAELGIELIAKLLGTTHSWYSSYLDKNPVEG